MVDGEALLGIPSFKVLRSVIGSGIPAGPVLKFWGVLQQLQKSTGVPSSEESATQLAAEKQWEDLVQGIKQLEARRKTLEAAVGQASMELDTDRTLRQGIEAELSQTKSQVEWVHAHSTHLATPTRPQRSKFR
jgi:phosphoenolpyruvate-protein kinase (PTS system EI component)